jgi:hypothetical protein
MRIFSPLAGAGLYDTIGSYMYLFKRLEAVFGARFYRFEHIVTYSSGKVTGKVIGESNSALPRLSERQVPHASLRSAASMASSNSSAMRSPARISLSIIHLAANDLSRLGALLRLVPLSK